MPERWRRLGAVALLGLLWPVWATAELDLSSATRERLDNGLTVVVLEEHSFPVVSVQMLYRVGAKHEITGATGLAHFLEHMAFRSSENFPDTDLVSRIYAVGGEWHGYTWLDQTTYFATAGKDYLELLLRIEADRMGRLDIPQEMVEAERGAVLSEMSGYENDPDAVLQDNLLYLSFLAHPYRNNTIGWRSDVAGITHDELLAFYRRHYQPGNAVLAVVGDVEREQVLAEVRKLFGAFTGSAPTPPPRTVEPPQNGERRIRLHGAVERKYFRMAWRAPSVHSPDYAAFLLLQEALSGGSGVSFLQNDWGTPARADAPLGRVTPDIASWYPPSEQDYVFTVSGSIAADGDEAALETGVTAAVESLREVNAATVERARQAVLRALRFDLQTTEDAAHQLAFFAGMDALEVLLGLPDALRAVQAEDLARLAAAWLQRSQRSVAWMVPATAVAPLAEASSSGPVIAGPQGEQAGAPPQFVESRQESTAALPPAPEGRVPAPEVRRLGGMTVIIEPSAIAPTLHVKAILPRVVDAAGFEVQPDDPGPGLVAADRELLPGELDAALAALAGASPAPQSAVDAGDAPLQRLDQLADQVLGLHTQTAAASGTRPLLLIIGGDIAADAALAAVRRHFGDAPADASTDGRAAPGEDAGPATAQQRMDIESRLDHAVAQEALGYVVPAPGPQDPESAAWQLALYLFSHDYEGRLGKQAISRRGLVYYIDAGYGSDGRRGWIKLAMGVDPQKLPAMRTLLREELQRLWTQPPGQADLEEARAHLLGRQLSGAISHRERADRAAREWLWYGGPLDYPELERRLQAVTLDDLRAILPAFAAGTVIAIRNPATH